MQSKFLKIHFALLFSFFIFHFSFSQTNLVPNGSFETYTACPNSFTGSSNNFTGLANWWVSSPSPDYYNTCASYSSCVSVPYNGPGFQAPFSGNAYCGAYTFQRALGLPGLIYREYMSAQLTTILSVGTKYYFSMQIARGLDTNFYTYSCSQGANISTNNMGMLLTTNKYDLTHNLSYRNFAHVYSGAVITDTTNWTQIKGSFIADSAYKYINLGNFFDNTNTDTVYSFHYGPMQSNPEDGGAYYYIDEVILSTDSSILSIPQIKQTDLFTVYPNSFSTNYFFIKTPINIDQINIYNCFGESISFEINKEDVSILRILFNEFINKGTYVLELRYQSKIAHYLLIKN